MKNMKQKAFYLAGPMSGIPQFNFPAFFNAAQLLREGGITIYSPAEMDEPATRAMALASKDGAHTGEGESWGTCLARDVKLIADVVDGIIFLPNWYKSRGARLEAYVGLLCKREFHYYLGDGRTERAIVSDVWGKTFVNTDHEYDL